MNIFWRHEGDGRIGFYHRPCAKLFNLDKKIDGWYFTCLGEEVSFGLIPEHQAKQSALAIFNRILSNIQREIPYLSET